MCIINEPIPVDEADGLFDSNLMKFIASKANEGNEVTILRQPGSFDLFIPLIEKEAYPPMITRAAPTLPVSDRYWVPYPVTDIPDVETDPKPFDRDRVAIADPFSESGVQFGHKDL